MPGFGSIKERARRTVHKQFAVPVDYYLEGESDPVELEKPLTARFHNRIALSPEPAGGGYAQIIQGITRVIFDRGDLVTAGITPKRGDNVVFGEPYNATVMLDQKDSDSGPVTEKWSVSRM